MASILITSQTTRSRHFLGGCACRTARRREGMQKMTCRKEERFNEFTSNPGVCKSSGPSHHPIAPVNISRRPHAQELLLPEPCLQGVILPYPARSRQNSRVEKRQHGLPHGMNHRKTGSNRGKSTIETHNRTAALQFPTPTLHAVADFDLDASFPDPIGPD